ncbi:hypothetical protein ACIRPK_23945 [Kitasatospora sp. NPDC101801]|uniref:hypothetical protein n=1 Tax=Bacillati TaxID=1783272 RepID=UPI003819597F
MSLADAIDYILTTATETDLDRVIDAVRDRNRNLGKIRSAAVTVGSTVTTKNLDRKFLVGLTGTVATIQGKFAALTLDEASTNQLRWARQTTIKVPADTKNFLLNGIPLACLSVSS